MSIFQGMSLDQLIEADKELKALIKTKKAEAKNELLAEFKQKADALGIDINDLVGKKASVVKYRNPENKSQTWSGRGKKAKWLKDQLDAGKKLEDFRV